MPEGAPCRGLFLAFQPGRYMPAISHADQGLLCPATGSAGHPVAVGPNSLPVHVIRGGTNRRRHMALPDYSMRQLLEAGVHFGHQAHRWNPKMGELHLRRSQQHPHHRSRPDRADAASGVAGGFGYRRQGRPHPVRRHQASGAGRHRGSREKVRAILRQFALARRHADQLEDDLRIDLPAAQARRDALLERGAGLHQEGAPRSAARARQARPLARRHQGDGRPARHAVRDRHQQGRHRDQGSAAAEHPGRCDRRYQLRSERDHLCGSRQ